MATLPHDDPLATAVTDAIRTGDQTALHQLRTLIPAGQSMP
jgi:hypothetical protein